MAPHSSSELLTGALMVKDAYIRELEVHVISHAPHAQIDRRHTTRFRFCRYGPRGSSPTTHTVAQLLRTENSVRPNLGASKAMLELL